jgi:phage repressor protein C with HTH and peptisase S24 domain
MAPTLRPGDRLCIEAVSGEEARSGDVVIARRGGRLTAHRLTARRGGSVITRGDGNSFEDPPLPASQVVGRVVEVVRDGRRSRPAPRPGLVARAVRWLVRATT